MFRFLQNFAFLFLAALVLSPAAAFAQNDERAMGGIGLTVFKDRNFRGTSATYTRDMPSLTSVGFNRNISSLRVGPGERWEICDQQNYRGRCVVVYGEESNLGTNNWENKIASFRRVGGSTTPNPGPSNPYIVLFDQVNYRGNPTNYDGPAGNLNRRARSITVGRGVWEVCDGSNFTGRCVTIDKSVPNLSSIGMSRRIASVRPAGAAPEPPPGSDWYVVVFSNSNYRGSPANYNGAQTNINRRVGSITIGKGVWEVCTGRNFTGSCQTLSQSVANFGSLGIGTNIRSIRPVMPQPR